MASRKEAKEQARLKRIAEEQARAAQQQRTRRLQMLGGVVVAAVAIVVVLIAVSSGGSSSKGGIPKTAKAKTAVVNTVNSLLNGIPQDGTTLGDPSAKVTMTYFGDLECPICADFTIDGGFSQLVQDQVRTGKVKVVYRSFCTATCNDEGQTVFNTQQAAAYAAGLQKRFWNYAELFYREQGTEGSGYVTTTFLNGLAAQVAGLDYETWQTGQKNAGIVSQVLSDQKLAAAKGLTGTPTLIFTGPTGKQSQPSSSVPSYSDLESAIKDVS